MTTIAARFPAVPFGTSGVRALVSDLTSEVVASYVYAFIERMINAYNISEGSGVVVGMDLRPSSPEIAAVICSTLVKMGYEAEFVGPLPTPALALRCLSKRNPGVMVTGSHIPFDRNGIKFYSPVGEILKEDEKAISACSVSDEKLVELTGTERLPDVCPIAALEYSQRYVSHFGHGCLRGCRVGVYEHSAVGRDITKAVLMGLGATVIALGRSDKFVPVDTEAVSERDLDQAAFWCAEHQLDALVSTDGDGDRPLVFDAKGQFIRGDILGLLCARSLEVQFLAVPVSCNTVVEKTGIFKRVVRTRIGSPYVVEAMGALLKNGNTSVGGFEANGGFFLGAGFSSLVALPTRDALLPIVAVLAAAATSGVSLDSLVRGLPKRFTYSDRIKNFPRNISDDLLSRLSDDVDFRQTLFPKKSIEADIDATDGIRITFEDEDIIHIRPSGNAPELRCYTEAESFEAAKKICENVLDRLGVLLRS